MGGGGYSWVAQDWSAQVLHGKSQFGEGGGYSWAAQDWSALVLHEKSQFQGWGGGGVFLSSLRTEVPKSFIKSFISGVGVVFFVWRLNSYLKT